MHVPSWPRCLAEDYMVVVCRTRHGGILQVQRIRKPSLDRGSMLGATTVPEARLALAAVLLPRCSGRWTHRQANNARKGSPPQRPSKDKAPATKRFRGPSAKPSKRPKLDKFSRSAKAPATNKFSPGAGAGPYDFVGDAWIACGSRQSFLKLRQSWAVPLLLDGKVAYLLPLLQLLIDGRQRGPKRPGAVVIAPTRELAAQIAGEASWLVAGTSIKVAVIYGGVPYRSTRDALSQGADLLVATPGRLEDACDRGDVVLRDVEAAVLDEADQMLDLGFEDQIRILLTRRMPRTGGGRQTAMFSATFGIGVQHLAADFLDAYTFVAVGRVGGAAQTVEQRLVWVEDQRKAQALLGTLLALESSVKGPCSVLVFANTKDAVRLIEDKIRAWRFRAFSIHGDKKQDAREKALQLFRRHAEGHISNSRDSAAVLVATDVAARGLDIPDITCVVHYDLPRRIDDFVHRSGRTGRLGRNGLSIGFANARAKGLSKDLVKCLAEAGAKIPPWLLGMAISTGEDLETLEALGHSSAGGGYGAQDVRLQGAGVQTAAERREAQKLRSFAEDAYGATAGDGSDASA
ncbi:DBP1 [Symbiodinium natans]|uniref:RNA helicase n=1 Tax=Symbiodinium natans TaxID=878477 RepID=A0A812JEY3_9DINO|nr:DBP1 [Symbiodinium natans]